MLLVISFNESTNLCKYEVTEYIHKQIYVTLEIISKFSVELRWDESMIRLPNFDKPFPGHPCSIFSFP